HEIKRILRKDSKNHPTLILFFHTLLFIIFQLLKEIEYKYKIKEEKRYKKKDINYSWLWHALVSLTKLYLMGNCT
ncbi:MAG: hypothetical protein ACK4NF_06915, partial [Planctomycetota bacterium]